MVGFLRMEVDMEDVRQLVRRTEQLRDDVARLSFDPALYVYNPLQYAWEPHRIYLETWCDHPVDLLLLGMNPGPFGMAQTGVPFGEVNAVRDFLGIQAPVGQPSRMHPKRPVLGFSCTRSEVSGRRLWGFLQNRYHTASACFSQLCVMNYCPLAFVDPGPMGKNITPDHLDRSERQRLDAICDAYLEDVIAYFQPKALVGVGQYAKAKLAPFSQGRVLSSIIHPSPGNPQANHGWAEKTEITFQEIFEAIGFGKEDIQ
ncbi:MAG: single-stranded DNA-binding protein [Sphaerochaeta sp.]|nr:single-stranded DNA-binding protein [Sphaerochaeta sp.]MCI2104465.1 single-stranded DNA-binding protein [Sphaerochaeta sp.]